MEFGTNISNVTGGSDGIFDSTKNVHSPTLNATALAIVDFLLMLVILIGNGLTMCALRLGRKLANVVGNKYILSLACSDTVVGLMLPYHLAFYITEDVWLAKHQITCLLRFVMTSLACCASLINILLIAIDRYVAVVHPLRYARYATHQTANYLILMGWACSLAMSTAPLYWNKWEESLQNLKSGQKICELYTVLQPGYITYVLTPAFASVWVAMLLLYCRIWREARGHAIRMRNTPSQPSNINDKKSIQVVFLVLGSFSLCWLPYFILILTALVQGDGSTIGQAPSVAYESAFTLAMANSALNPLIYAWKNRSFRRALLRLIKCQAPDQPGDETDGIFPVSARKNKRDSTQSQNNTGNKIELQVLSNGGTKINGKIDNLGIDFKQNIPKNVLGENSNCEKPYDLKQVSEKTNNISTKIEDSPETKLNLSIKKTSPIETSLQNGYTNEVSYYNDISGKNDDPLQRKNTSTEDKVISKATFQNGLLNEVSKNSANIEKAIISEEIDTSFKEIHRFTGDFHYKSRQVSKIRDSKFVKSVSRELLIPNGNSSKDKGLENVELSELEEFDVEEGENNNLSPISDRADNLDQKILAFDNPVQKFDIGNLESSAENRVVRIQFSKGSKDCNAHDKDKVSKSCLTALSNYTNGCTTEESENCTDLHTQENKNSSEPAFVFSECDCDRACATNKELRNLPKCKTQTTDLLSSVVGTTNETNCHCLDLQNYAGSEISSIISDNNSNLIEDFSYLQTCPKGCQNISSQDFRNCTDEKCENCAKLPGSCQNHPIVKNFNKSNLNKVNVSLLKSDIRHPNSSTVIETSIIEKDNIFDCPETFVHSSVDSSSNISELCGPQSLRNSNGFLENTCNNRHFNDAQNENEVLSVKVDLNSDIFNVHNSVFSSINIIPSMDTVCDFCKEKFPKCSRCKYDVNIPISGTNGKKFQNENEFKYVQF